MRIAHWSCKSLMHWRMWGKLCVSAGQQTKRLRDRIRSDRSRANEMMYLWAIQPEPSPPPVATDSLRIAHNSSEWMGKSEREEMWIKRICQWSLTRAWGEVRWTTLVNLWGLWARLRSSTVQATHSLCGVWMEEFYQSQISARSCIASIQSLVTGSVVDATFFRKGAHWIALE